MNIRTKTFGQFKKEDRFGLVIMGASGDLNRWAESMERMLKDRDIVAKDKVTFKDAYVISGNIFGNAGRRDLVLIFSKQAEINVRNLSGFKMEFGEISWIDDFKFNYAKDYR